MLDPVVHELRVYLESRPHLLDKTVTAQGDTIQVRTLLFPKNFSFRETCARVPAGEVLKEKHAAKHSLPFPKKPLTK